MEKLTIEKLQPIYGKSSSRISWKILRTMLEPRAGFEPAISALPRRCPNLLGHRGFDYCKAVKEFKGFCKREVFLEMFILGLSSTWCGRGFPSLVKGARLRTLSHRRSWVRIPPPAPPSARFISWCPNVSLFLWQHFISPDAFLINVDINVNV